MVEADREAGFRVYADSYGAGPGTVASLAEVSLDNRWVADEAGDVVGILRELPFRQAFGGRFVVSHGIGAVGIALHARSRGISRALMSGILTSLYERGVPLSMLYASTMAAYRPVGYELAGSRVVYQLPLEHLPRSQPLAVEPWGDADLTEVAECLNRICLASNGMMGRPDYWWQQRVFNPLDDDSYLYRYRVREGGRTTGFIVYTLRFENRPDFPIQWVPGEKECVAVVARDLFWETREAAQSLLAFAAGQRAVGTNLYWEGPPNDHLHGFLAEHLPRSAGTYAWMLRLVDVKRALEERGFPPGLDTRLDLTVVDPVIAANDRSFSLSVADGRCTVDAAATARMTIPVGAFASLYSGWLSPVEAVRTGALTGASDVDIQKLTAMFAGPLPWMNEFF
jgi:predicted acetyltransferase